MALQPGPETAPIFSAVQFRQNRYETVNNSLIPLAETAINVSLPTDVYR
jgi:hypothetical protein